MSDEEYNFTLNEHLLHCPECATLTYCPTAAKIILDWANFIINEPIKENENNHKNENTNP